MIDPRLARLRERSSAFGDDPADRFPRMWTTHSGCPDAL